ncbi:TonB-dependent receptor [Methylosinus sp. H3A]|uniref:TonB-dependent receptor n=1 Tax=Methylosinus sp. H3A TaxID=2785786 RepID=UPI0018C33131|nr:TonB-dependent receptor [Methylosinus sp. H3A]MBG0811297.1 TonB-dependent receptor [Methylosinus sp. H3A]
MNKIKAPFSLRSLRRGVSAPAPRIDGPSAKVLGAAALLVAGVGVATAQESTQPLPAVRVDAPKEKPKPVVRAAPATHHAATPRRTTRAPAQPAGPQQGAQGAQTAQTGAGGGAAPADANPYADPKAPYKADRLSSNKFTQPLLNTPRTVTVLTKEILEDKNATTLKEIARSTAGVTLGSGEGGNAFGDRFFIRGFDARNDIFVDGVRDPGVSLRENFYTEQVEILRGPGSSFAGRGTAGGALNIVTKQAKDQDFTDMKFSGGPSDNSKRIAIDVNKAISPILAVRVNGLFQDANVAGRNYITDDRNGVSGSVVFKPIENFTLTANYTHSYQNGLPDFGIPYNRIANRPFSEGVTSRNTWYGLLNRDFQKYRQDFGTFTGEYRVNDDLKITSRLRQSRSIVDYIGTLTQSANQAASSVNIGAQSRYQVTNVLASQTDINYKFATGPVKHEVVLGAEFSREGLTRTNYQGLVSEFNGLASVGGALVCNLYLPCNALPFPNTPYRNQNVTRVAVDTKAGYLIETANYEDIVIANAGVRFDDYTITNRNEAYTTFAANHSSLVNYNFGLVLKPLPEVSLYAAYATSANPVGAELDGGAANYGGLTTAAQIFAPQRNYAKEIGAKWELFDRHLLATAALFRTDVTGAREVNGSVTSGDAAYYVQGADLEIAGNITDKWSVTGGVVIMESKVTRSQISSNVGLQLANIAHESFSLLSKYKLGDLFGLDPDTIEFGGQAVYRSKIYGGNNIIANGATSVNGVTGWPAPTAANPFVNVPTALPSYWRFDAFLEGKVTENITLKVSVVNMFDRTYYDAFYQTATPFTQVAPGRTVLFEARAKF